MPPLPLSRVRLFVALAAVCTLTIAIVVVAAARSRSEPAGSAAAAVRLLAGARAGGPPALVVRSLDRDDPAAFGHVAVAALGARTATRIAPARCARVAVAASSGLCLARATGFGGGYEAEVLGPDLRVRHRLAVAGIPSRARVSPDGRLGSVTLFVLGHSYAAAGAFSTRTTLIDLVHGTRVGQLEDFTTYRGEHQVTAVDVNFWGVTFARDGDGFLATLATGGRTYLVRGSVRARTMRTLTEDVECPSLSPDGTRVAFKARGTNGPGRWRLSVLDLRTLRRTPLAERRSVDDQVAWRDDGHVLYGLDGDVWQADADGGGRPSVLLRRAASPTVLER